MYFYFIQQLLLFADAGMLIMIIASDSDTIGDTFRVSLSVFEILLWRNIDNGISDYFVCGIVYWRHFYRVLLT